MMTMDQLEGSGQHPTGAGTVVCGKKPIALGLDVLEGRVRAESDHQGDTSRSSPP